MAKTITPEPTPTIVIDTDTRADLVASNPADADVYTFLNTTANQYQFAIPAQPPLPSYPTMIWGKRVKVIEGTNVKKPCLITAGLIRKDVYPDLDEAFERAETPYVKIEHLSKKQGTYWRLDEFEAFLMCKSVPVKYSEDSFSTYIPHVWNNHQGPTNGSHMQIMMFLRKFMAFGYNKPIIFSISRSVIPILIQELLKQFTNVITPLQTAYNDAGGVGPLKLAYYCMSINVIKGEETMVGSQQTTMILPPFFDIPAVINAEYLFSHFIQPDELQVIEAYADIIEMWAKNAVIQLTQPLPTHEEKNIAAG